MRLNIFEQIKNTNINYKDEMQRIEKLFSIEKVAYCSSDYRSIESYINKSSRFASWKYRSTFLNTYDLRESLQISATDIYKQDNLATMLNYFEFIINMITLVSNDKDMEKRALINIITIMNNIKIIFERINYKIEKKEDFSIIIEKDPKAIAIAELYDDISDNIIEYRRFAIQGNIERKKEVLSTLSKKVEAIELNLKQNNYSYLVDELTGLLNSLDIRHNNKEGKHAHEKIIVMPPQEQEEWCDRTYDTILLALMINHYLGYKGDIKSLNKELKK